MPRMTRITDTLYCVDVTPPELGVPFICSYIVVSRGEAAVIETGPTSSTEILVEALNQLGTEVKAVIPTHIHLDHGGGVGSLLKHLESAKAYVHPRAVKHLADPAKLWAAARYALGWLAEVYQAPEPAPRERLVAAEDGAKIRVGDMELRIVHTPGHASHHQSILMEDGTLFVGDSAGIYIARENYVIPTTMPVIRLDLYLESLEKQIALNPSRIAYTHYGVAENGVGVLRRHRIQVDAWVRGVREALEAGEESNEAILGRIARYDPEAEKLKGIVGKSRAYEILVRLSVEGLVMEVRRQMQG